jgi:GGDEF domain-containing protein
MGANSQQRSSGVLSDHIGIAWAIGGLGVVILATVAFYGAGVSAGFATGVATAYAVALSAALVKRNTRHWRLLLARVEAETRRRLASTEQTSTFSAQFFLERLGQECRRSVRYGLDLSVVRLRCDAAEVAKLGAGEQASAAVLTATAAHLRSEDVVGRLSDLEYAFFLPHTKRVGAEIVLARLDALGPLVEAIGLAVFGEDGMEPNDLLRAAGADSERRLVHAERERGWNQRSLVN